jgi:hypothetical protein
MLTTEQRQNIKAVPITAYLAGKGFLPVLETGGEYCYFSPFRKERTPSFFVNAARNICNDFADPENGGDNIKLVMRLEQCDFIQAVKILLSVDQSLEIELMQNLPASPQYQSFINKVVLLTSNPLKTYLYTERGLIQKYCVKRVSEVHYSTSKGSFYSIGFKNDLGGWELRNAKFKGCIGKKAITTINASDSNCLIFEGFMDYLSYLTDMRIEHHGGATIIVLNSLSLISQLPDLNRFKLVGLYLDNDDSGIRAAEKLTAKYSHVYNTSATCFPEFKDYNEFLLSKKLWVQPKGNA